MTFRFYGRNRPVGDLLGVDAATDARARPTGDRVVLRRRRDVRVRRHARRATVRVRYRWTSVNATPQWEQAFSEDGGETLETNWTAEFTRAA